MTSILQVDGAGKSYGDFVMRDISFSLPSGFIMGLIGPNGSGKTTLIKMILNLIRRDSGMIKAFGLDACKDEVEVRRRIGFVHEVPSYYEHLTLKALKKSIAPFYSTWDEPRFLELCRRFELPLKKRFKKLSRGMKMKFSLALAFSHHADLYILDEPTSGLDPVSRNDLLTLMQELIGDENRSILFSTHITSDLERIADYICFILNGRQVFFGSRDETMEQWKVVRGELSLLDNNVHPFLTGVRKHAFGFDALTCNEGEIRKLFGKAAVIERASLEDIMYYHSREEKHA